MANLSGTTMQGLAPTFVHKRLLRGAAGFLTGGPLGAVGGFIGGGGNGGGSFQPQPFQPLTGCQPGFERDIQTGRCKKSGIIGTIQRTLPGGETGFGPGTDVALPGQNTGLVVGAVAPIMRQTITRVCPKRFILGADGNCYLKQLLPVKLRMHRPDKRPPISASQWSKLKTAESVRKKAKDIAVVAGFSCKKR